MTDDFDGIGWREYMRGIENGNIDPTGERLRAVCRLAREALAANNQEAWVAALLNAPNPEQAITATPAAQTASQPTAGGDVVAYRWRPHGATNWIYDPTQQWLLSQDWNEIQVQPLYAAQPASPLRGRESFEAFVKRAGFTDWSRYGDGYAKPLIDRMWTAWSPPEQPAAAPVAETAAALIYDEMLPHFPNQVATAPITPTNLRQTLIDKSKSSGKGTP